MSQLLCVCLGGAVGSGARWLVSLWAASKLPPDFAWGTIVVNMLGSFLMALLAEVVISTRSIGPDARLFLTTGVLGGFTTYSAFNQETLELVEQGALGPALLNVVGTVCVCFGAGCAGAWLARAMSSA